MPIVLTFRLSYQVKSLMKLNRFFLLFIIHFLAFEINNKM